MAIDFKKTVAALLIIGTLLSFSACKKEAIEDITTSSTEKNVEAVITTTLKATEPETEASTKKQNKSASNPSLRRYNTLSKAEKEIYNRLKEGFDSTRESIFETASEFNSQIVDRTFFYSFLVDNPEYFFVRGNSYVYEDVDYGRKFFKFKPEYIYSKSELESRISKINSIYKSIKSNLNKNSNDFEKAKAVYDYLIDNCSYDNSYSGNSLEEAKTTASFADGALIDKKAVCSGYSRAFKLMMDKFSIECTCVCNDNHEWNMVYIDGNYYHIDVTWADDGSADRYKYFCVSDATIYKNHRKATGDYPECVIDY